MGKNHKNRQNHGRIFTNLEEALEDEPLHLSMGIKPSGDLHLGSYSTLLLALYAIKQLPKAELDLEIMDLDFDSQRGNRAIPFLYQRRTDPNSGEELPVSDILKAQLESAIQGLSEFLGGDISKRVNLRKFSEVLSDPKMIAGFAKAFQNRESRNQIKRAIADGLGNPQNVPLYPICPECHYSSSAMGYLRGDTIEADCNNSNCLKGHYHVSLLEPGAYNIHYLVDPIRDTIETPNHPQAQLHIFGGDYALRHGSKGLSKAERVLKVYHAVTPTPPSIYTGPEITVGDMKMSKSGGIGIPIRRVENLEEIADTILRLAKKGVRTIDALELNVREISD